MNLVITFCPSRLVFFVRPPAEAEHQARHRWQAKWLTNGYEVPQLVGFAGSPEEALERIATHRADEARCGRTPLPAVIVELVLSDEPRAERERTPPTAEQMFKAMRSTLGMDLQPESTGKEFGHGTH